MGGSHRLDLIRSQIKCHLITRDRRPTTTATHPCLHPIHSLRLNFVAVSSGIGSIPSVNCWAVPSLVDAMTTRVRFLCYVPVQYMWHIAITHSLHFIYKYLSNVETQDLILLLGTTHTPSTIQRAWWSTWLVYAWTERHGLREIFNLYL